MRELPVLLTSQQVRRWCFRSVPPSPYLQTCQAGWECPSQHAFLHACSRHYHELKPNLTCGKSPLSPRHSSSIFSIDLFNLLPMFFLFCFYHILSSTKIPSFTSFISLFYLSLPEVFKIVKSSVLRECLLQVHACWRRRRR